MLDQITEYVRGIGGKVAKIVGDYTPNGFIKKINSSDLRYLFGFHSLNDLLHYEVYDDETSLFINRKSLCFILEAGTLIGSSEEIENILASIITDSLPHYADIQFLLWASPKIEPFLEAFHQQRSKDETFAWLAQKRVDAFLVPDDAILYGRQSQILTLSARRAIPAIYFSRTWTDAGGLMSYGPVTTDLGRQAGIYVGRILKGDKPADLPGMQASKLELVINHQTARLLNVNVPQTLLATADEVIE